MCLYASRSYVTKLKEEEKKVDIIFYANYYLIDQIFKAFWKVFGETVYLYDCLIKALDQIIDTLII